MYSERRERARYWYTEWRECVVFKCVSPLKPELKKTQACPGAPEGILHWYGKMKGGPGSSPGKFWNLRWLKFQIFNACSSTQDTNQSGSHQNFNCWFTFKCFWYMYAIGYVCFVKWRMWSRYFRPLLRSAQTAEDDGHSLGQRHCRAGWCLEDLSSLCGRSGSSDGSVFVASWYFKGCF